MSKYKINAGELMNFLAKIDPDANIIVYSYNDETELPAINDETYEYDPQKKELSIFGYIPWS